MASEPLKRLGGGRWETRDARFAIEPESGTWVVIDREQTDELGLPLVRGPFPSLTAAKADIAEARAAGPVESPLARRLARTPEPQEPDPARQPAVGRRKAAATGAGVGAESAPSPPGPPKAPAQPRWMRNLTTSARREAQSLVERLEAAGTPDPLTVARTEIVDDEPAVARLALERRLGALAAQLGRDDVEVVSAVEAAVELVMEGRDHELDVEWRLVDGSGRAIRRLRVGPGELAAPAQREPG